MLATAIVITLVSKANAASLAVGRGLGFLMRVPRKYRTRIFAILIAKLNEGPKTIGELTKAAESALPGLNIKPFLAVMYRKGLIKVSKSKRKTKVTPDSVYISESVSESSKTAGVVYQGKTFPGYNTPITSSRSDKKRMVLVKHKGRVKLVHYGQKGYKHNYSPEAKKSYLARSAGIRGKDGRPTASDPFSPNYWARKDLWPSKAPADGSTLHKTAFSMVKTASYKNTDYWW